MGPAAAHRPPTAQVAAATDARPTTMAAKGQFLEDGKKHKEREGEATLRDQGQT